MGDENPICTLGDYSKPSHKGYRKRMRLCLFQFSLCDQASNWLERLPDLSLYDNEGWNDPRDFAKLVKAITLPQDVKSTSDRHLIKLENQAQCLMEAHLASTQPNQVNRITTLCKICSGPHDTQYCMKDPEQAFVEYASSRTDGTRSRQFTTNQGPRIFDEAANSWKEKPNFNWAHA
ncbi:hypothetical protein Tco_1091296 [Tanacetum coccineum]|uniref:MAK10-like protein n=1 Tax=Tanacetum coccineum TaxID=301880 RepID=A0ABQ5I6M3_9ASTR